MGAEDLHGAVEKAVNDGDVDALVALYEPDACLLGPAGESIPVRDGELCLGTWQRVLFIELDRSRPRRWLCKVVGS